jgi:hypothetical protein
MKVQLCIDEPPCGEPFSEGTLRNIFLQKLSQTFCVWYPMQPLKIAGPQKKKKKKK